MCTAEYGNSILGIQPLISTFMIWFWFLASLPILSMPHPPILNHRLKPIFSCESWKAKHQSNKTFNLNSSEADHSHPQSSIRRPSASLQGLEIKLDGKARTVTNWLDPSCYVLSFFHMPVTPASSFSSFFQYLISFLRSTMRFWKFWRQMDWLHMVSSFDVSSPQLLPWATLFNLHHTSALIRNQLWVYWAKFIVWNKQGFFLWKSLNLYRNRVQWTPKHPSPTSTMQQPMANFVSSMSSFLSHPIIILRQIQNIKSFHL